MASDNCIINVALDYWYPSGQKRLVESLNSVGFNGDILTWTNEWPNDNYNKENLYNCKASAFEEAIAIGYKNILWLDCSIWALRPVDEIFEIIDKTGFYFIDNGYNCAQTCSDKCLEYFDVIRDHAESFKEVATGFMGVNIENSASRKFIYQFIKACKDGAADGSRLHDGQSEDPRFLFHRQDQSVASVILNKMGIAPTDQWGNLVEYFPEKVTEKTIFTLRGL